MSTIKGIEALKSASLLAGSPFFSEESMAIFQSIVYPEVYPGNYFITSEIMPGDTTRLWKVRQFKQGRIKTKPPSFPSLAAAKDFLKAYLEK